MHRSDILVHVRITLNLDEQLLKQARECTGIQQNAALIHSALRELIATRARKRLAALGGTMPGFQGGRRRGARPAG